MERNPVKGDIFEYVGVEIVIINDIEDGAYLYMHYGDIGKLNPATYLITDLQLRLNKTTKFIGCCVLSQHSFYMVDKVFKD